MLEKFLAKLGEDTELLEAYKKAPETTMKEFGLSDKEVTAILSGDVKQLKSLTDKASAMPILIVHYPDDK